MGGENGKLTSRQRFQSLAANAPCAGMSAMTGPLVVMRSAEVATRGCCYSNEIISKPLILLSHVPGEKAITECPVRAPSLAKGLPRLRVVGGCCGPDMRHIGALIAEGVGA